MSRWTATDLPDLTGRTVIVTGASSGLGRASARAFAGAGAHVVLAVRDRTRGEAAAATMPGSVELRIVDLASLESVRAFADGWNAPIDILVNNAGIMAVPQGRTTDGFESQFGTNHLGPFALTNLLLPAVTGRVVTVSSGAHRSGTLDLDDLNWRSRRYRRIGAYAQSKLANLLFTLELQRRLDRDGSSVRSLAAHPGYAATNLQTSLGNAFANRVGAVANRLFAQSEEMGSLPILYAATQDVPGASYVGPDGPLEHKGYPALVGRTADASDVGLGKRLWSASEELTGVSYPG